MTQSLSDSAKKIMQCCRQGNLHKLQELLDDGLAIEAVNHPDFTPLNMALKHGRWKVAQYLLENQMVPNKTKCPPLIAATQYKKDVTQGMEMVFAHTANLDVTDHNGRTALMTACLLGHEKKVTYLLNNHDVLEAVDHAGMTAFLDAVISQSNTVIESLITHKANVNHFNLQGDNALLIAVQQQNPSQKTIKTLLENNVDATYKNHRGKSAFSVAEKKQPTLFKLMVKKIEAEKQIELPLFASNDMPVEQQPLTSESNQQPSSQIAAQAKPEQNNTHLPDENHKLWFDAINEGNLGRLNKLRVKGVEVDSVDNKGCTGLIHAAVKDTVQWLHT